MGVGLPDFREGQVEKQGQNWENAQFPRDLKGNFYSLSLDGKNIPHFTILTPNLLFDSRTEPENSKKTMFVNKFLNISSILNLSLPLFPG